MKTFQQWSTDWFLVPQSRRRVDFDGVEHYQCVDLVKDYLSKVHGITAGGWGNAINYWYFTNRILLEKFKKAGNVDPQAGDIAVFETNKTPIVRGKQPGHIAVATGKHTAATMEIIEQNGSTGSGDGVGENAIRYRWIAKSRLAGLLRPRTTTLPNTYVLPPIGSRIQLLPGYKRTTYRAGTGIGVGVISPRDNSFIYEVRGYDPVYKNRILINSKSAGGDGIALALYYLSGGIVEGWKKL